MSIVFTLDHRHGDAAILVPFLKAVKDYIEDPDNFKPENHPTSISYAELALRKSQKKTQ